MMYRDVPPPLGMPVTKRIVKHLSRLGKMPNIRANKPTFATVAGRGKQRRVKQPKFGSSIGQCRS